MTEYIAPILAALAVLIAASWYCWRRGHAVGYEAGRTKGLFEGAGVGRKDVWADVWNSSAAAKVPPPTQDLSGGPREPA